MDGKRESKKSVLLARHDNDDCYDLSTLSSFRFSSFLHFHDPLLHRRYIYIYIYIYIIFHVFFQRKEDQMMFRIKEAEWAQIIGDLEQKIAHLEVQVRKIKHLLSSKSSPVDGA